MCCGGYSFGYSAFYVDTTAAPGNFSTAAKKGRSAFSGASLTVVMTNSMVTATTVPLASMASGNGRTIEPITITPGSVTWRRTSGSIANEQFVWSLE